jgi:kinesin family member 5
LKLLLRKAQSQVTTFENYVSSLEGELQLWRTGETVPKEKWAPARTAEGASAPKTPRPATPSRLHPETPRAETPSRPDSRIGDRSSTPSLVLEKDEREEFLRRENELQDQLAEKESYISNVERSLQEAKDELKSLKENSSKTGKDNEKLNAEINELRMQLEKVSFESKEAGITMDSLKEANSELTTELDELKQQLLDARMRAKESTAALDEKDRRKAERMAKMMAGFDPYMNVFSDNERKIQDLIERVDSLHNTSAIGEAVAPDDLMDLRSRLVETQGFVRQAELTMNNRSDLSELHDSKRAELERRLEEAENGYEQLLQRSLGENDVDEIRQRLETLYVGRQETVASSIDNIKAELVQKDEELSKLRQSLTEAQSRSPSNGAAITGNKTLQQQIADFDNMKKSLMRDLQNRCERVIELEISLDETREQYNNVLRTSNNRAQQKKMAFLERNLEQLTHVQRQLVEQNSSLKKEVAIAERKLIARNERISSLENLLQESQHKLSASHDRYCPLPFPLPLPSLSVYIYVYVEKFYLGQKLTSITALRLNLRL